MKRTVKGWDEHVRKMARAADKLNRGDGVREVLEEVGHAAIRTYRTNIINEKTEDGKRFAPLSKPYAQQKRERWGNKPILRASGAMWDGFVFAIQRVSASKWSLIAGVSGTDADGVRNADKATWHIEGTDRMPARDFTVKTGAILKKAARDAFRALHDRIFGRGAA